MSKGPLGYGRYNDDNKDHEASHEADAVLSTLRDWLARERERLIDKGARAWLQSLGVVAWADLSENEWNAAVHQSRVMLDAALASLTSEEGEQT